MSIRLKATYPVKKDVVWHFLTHNSLLSEWCMPAKNFHLEIGAEFTFESKPSFFWDGKFFNKIIDYSRESFLEYECRSRWPKLDTVVYWEIIEKDGKTTLKLEHSGFRLRLLAKLRLRLGWRKILRKNLYRLVTAWE